MNESALDQAKRICDKVQESYDKIRHVGYYDSLGRILYDSGRKGLIMLEGEGTEEMHILNGTAASTLELWKRSDDLLGRMNAFIMIMEKIVDLIVPDGVVGAYFLVVFDKDAPVSEVERVRLCIMEADGN
jgi:hypothetical protein